MFNKKKDEVPYSVLEILSHRRYVIYKYNNKKIRALVWYLINKHHRKMEMKIHIKK